jgi:hypothetical protein
MNLHRFRHNPRQIAPKPEPNKILTALTLRRITQFVCPILSETYAAESGRVGFRIAMRI